LAIVSFGLVAAQPAAASTYWACMGPEVACGSAASPSGSSYNTRSRERVYAGEERRGSGYRSKERYAGERPERQKASVRVAAVNPHGEERVTADTAPAPVQKKVAMATDRLEAPKAVSESSSITLTKAAASHHTQSGMASYYGTESGSQTASGARFVPSAMTAAHRSLPFGTKVLVTNKANGRSVIVTINDRGPFVGGRVIDLSTGAAGAIGMLGAGVAPVSLEVLGKG
jgi:rare lipoprotein A